MRAHLVQLNLAWEDKVANFRAAHEAVASAGPETGDLVVLPEMFDTGFSFNLDTTRDDAGGGAGPTLAFLSGLAREHGVFVQGARTLVGPDARGRNAAPVIGPGGELIAEYHKIHPFSFGRESSYFTGGERVVTYAWTREEGESFTVCPAICYDLRFPELFRAGLGMGAEVFALGANWPAPRAHHWRALLIARAIENQAYVLGVNRCGSDPTLAYAGGSIAVGPKGEVLGELGDTPGVLSVEMTLRAVREWRETFPAWRDRRLP